jgi:hypothetical protein
MRDFERRGAAATAKRSEIMPRRFAALGGVCGAIMVPGALLALSYLLLAGEPLDRLPLALVLTAVVAGAVLMILARWRAGGARVAAARTSPVRLVAEASSVAPRQRRKSAA